MPSVQPRCARGCCCRDSGSTGGNRGSVDHSGTSRRKPRRFGIPAAPADGGRRLFAATVGGFDTIGCRGCDDRRPPPRAPHDAAARRICGRPAQPASHPANAESAGNSASHAHRLARAQFAPAAHRPARVSRVIESFTTPRSLTIGARAATLGKLCRIGKSPRIHGT